MKSIAVIDAQGAGIGQTIIKMIKNDEVLNKFKIIALGTNETAACNMIKCGSDSAVIGNRNICDFLRNQNVYALIGPIGIICNGGIKGEITSEISKAIFESNSKKYIMPLRMHDIYIPGTRSLDIKDMILEILNDIKTSLNK